MTVLDHAPAPDAVLAFVDEQVRGLQEQGAEPRAILAGPVAYERLCAAMAARFGRAPGRFEQYQWLAITVDPFRGDRLCVVPTNADLAAGVRAETL